jgi:hypothetical protein
MDQHAELHAPRVADSATNEPARSSTYQRAYVLYCTNCGFVVTFRKRVVDEATPKEGGEDQSE